MIRFATFACAALVVGLTAPGLASGQSLPGKASIDMRLRSETVDQDGFAENAHALTLRTRAGYETGAWRGFRALIEAENLLALDRRYNSSTNGRTDLPAVADPQATELNRAQVSWTGAQADVTVGRQRIALANARYVANVPFRQNEQTFDAVKLGIRPASGVAFTYAYIDHVRRVFGPDSAQGDWSSDSHVLHAEAKTPAGQLTGYGYLLDLPGAAAQSGATWGARLSGSRPLAQGLALTYVAEIARQTDYGSAVGDFSVGFVDFAAGLRRGELWASVGVERLDGDGRRGFQTPLATLHAFQGWADVFLNTPGSGVRDVNLRAGHTLRLANSMPVRLQTAIHDFRDDDGSARYGRELDLLANVAVNRNVGFEAKVAFFDGAQPQFADRTKLWLSFEVRR